MIKTQNENDLIELTLNLNQKLVEFSQVDADKATELELRAEMNDLEDGIDAAVERVKADRGLDFGDMDV